MIVTCFNITGGYAIAASVISQANNEGSPIHSNTQNQHSLKKSTVDLRVVQVKKDDSENDKFLFPDLSHISNHHNYSYIPDFKLLNKHFLVHYSASIKDKELPAYILHQNFRL